MYSVGIVLYHAGVRKDTTRLMAVLFFPQLLCERPELLAHATWQHYTNRTFSPIFKRVSVIETFRQV